MSLRIEYVYTQIVIRSCVSCVMAVIMHILRNYSELRIDVNFHGSTMSAAGNPLEKLLTDNVLMLHP